MPGALSGRPAVAAAEAASVGSEVEEFCVPFCACSFARASFAASASRASASRAACASRAAASRSKRSRSSSRLRSLRSRRLSSFRRSSSDESRFLSRELQRLASAWMFEVSSSGASWSKHAEAEGAGPAGKPILGFLSGLRGGLFPRSMRLVRTTNAR